MHPLLILAVRQPHLLLEHAAAYGSLVSSELAVARGQWLRQALLGLAALSLFAVAVVLAGVALLLCASLGTQQMPAGWATWAFWAVPLVPALIAAICAWACMRAGDSARFQALHAQLEADAALWREMGAA